MAAARAAPSVATACSWASEAMPLPLSAVCAMPVTTSARLAAVTPLSPKVAISASLKAGLALPPAAVVSRRLTRSASASSSVTLSTALALCRPISSLNRARPWVLVAIAPRLTPTRWKSATVGPLPGVASGALPLASAKMRFTLSTSACTLAAVLTLSATTPADARALWMAARLSALTPLMPSWVKALSAGALRVAPLSWA